MRLKYSWIFIVSLFFFACIYNEPASSNLAQLGFYSPPETIITELQGKPSLSPAEHFMLGSAYKQQKQYRKAIVNFANSCFASRRNTAIKLFPGSVYEHAASYHIKSPYYDDAVYELADIYYLHREFDYVIKFVDLMRERKSSLYRDAAILKARALCEKNEYRRAVDSLNRILPLYRDPLSRSLIHIRLGSTYTRHKNPDSALSEYFEVIKINPDSWQSGIASAEILSLVEANHIDLKDDRRLLMGKALYHSRKYARAIAFLEPLNPRPGRGAEGTEAAHYLVRAYIQDGKASNADMLIRYFTSDGSHSALLKTKADELWKAGKKGEALSVYRSLADKNIPSISQAAMKRIALHSEKTKQPDFRHNLEKYLAAYPDDQVSEQCLYLLGRDSIRHKRMDEAGETFEKALARFPGGKHSDYSRFWLHRIYSDQGKHDDAERMAREMISFNPDSSYTWILLDRLARAAAKDRLYQSLHASGGDADRLLYYHTLLMLAENDLHKRSKRIDELRLGGAGTLNSLERRIANLDLDSDYEDVLRGIEKYFAIGSISRINREIESLPDDENVKKDKFIALAHFGEKYRHYHHCALSAIELLNLFNVKHNIALMPERTIRRLFPPAFEQCVYENAAQFGIEAPFIYAVIKAESLYNSEAESSAGAIGLMQLMPATARGLARQMKLNDYNLKDPCTSIAFGSHYLSWLDKAYKGSIELIVAGYNAGTGNVDRWRQQFDEKDVDMFTEQIPFDETRFYVVRTKKHFIQGRLVYPKSR